MPVYEQRLHHALNVISCFRERDTFYPINRVNLWGARIAIGLDPLRYVASAGIVRSEQEDERALPVLHQIAQVRGAKLSAVLRIQQALQVKLEPESPGG